MQRFSKDSALGGFKIEVEDNGIVRSSLSTEGELREFRDAREAVDFYAPMAQDNHSAWNICYILQDFVM
jgi:hypothetical protein